MSGDAVIKQFYPETTCDVTCQITQFQDQYFYTDSFQEAKEKLRYTVQYVVKVRASGAWMTACIGSMMYSGYK